MDKREYYGENKLSKEDWKKSDDYGKSDNIAVK